MTLFRGHLAAALVFATFWRATTGQGPLEWVTAAAGRAGRAVLATPDRSRAR